VGDRPPSGLSVVDKSLTSAHRILDQWELEIVAKEVQQQELLRMLLQDAREKVSQLNRIGKSGKDPWCYQSRDVGLGRLINYWRRDRRLLLAKTWSLSRYQEGQFGLTPQQLPKCFECLTNMAVWKMKSKVNGAAA